MDPNLDDIIIHSISFTPNTKYIACSTNKGVHLYELLHSEDTPIKPLNCVNIMTKNSTSEDCPESYVNFNFARITTTKKGELSNTIHLSLSDNIKIKKRNGTSMDLFKNDILEYNMYIKHPILYFTSNDVLNNTPLINSFSVTETKQFFTVREERIHKYITEKTANGSKQIKMDNHVNTYMNPLGICVIPPNNVHMLVTLGPLKGEVAIWRHKSNTYTAIAAHNSDIQQIAVSADGTLIATTSINGTVIKLFKDDGSQVRVLRRGIYSAKIHDLCFSNNNKYLACCSGNGTVHIFDLENNPGVSSGFASYVASFVMSSNTDSDCSFVKHKINDGFDMSLYKTVCAFDAHGVLHVLTTNGQYCRIYGDAYQILRQYQLPIATSPIA